MSDWVRARKWQKERAQAGRVGFIHMQWTGTVSYSSISQHGYSCVCLSIWSCVTQKRGVCDNVDVDIASQKRPIADTLRTPYASTNSSLSAHRKAPIAFILLSLSVLRLACVWLRLLLCVWLVYMRLLSHWICDRHSKLFYKVERPLDVHTLQQQQQQ